MGRKRDLKPVERARIVALRDAKWTFKKIATDIGCSISTVHYTLKNHKIRDTNSFETKLGRGRKSAKD